MSRTTMKPKVWSSPGAYRIWLKGMRNSATHPTESIFVATSHTASQDGSSLLSLET
jgi:hypothetical protein